MSGEEPGPAPFVPLPMHSGNPKDRPGPADEGFPLEVRVIYVRYRDPNPLEFPDQIGRLAGPVFHAAGVLLREDEEFLALGEIAFAQENQPLVGHYGAALFPAYRNVLTVPKVSILERQDFRISGAQGKGSPG